MSSLLNGIHEKVISGSPTASRELFLAATGPLSGFLTNGFPRLTDDERHDLVVDAILEYLQKPDRFDPSKSSLWSYLCMIAKRDATDLVRAAARHRKLLDKNVLTDVEFWASRAKYERYGEDEMDARHIMAMHGGRLATNPQEAAALKLLLSEERETAAYAAAMGIDPSAPDVETVVKKAKDRLLLRMKRLRDEL
jgi:DNA-directed RNA polymerase specialized sigma24 family protein